MAPIVKETVTFVQAKGLPASVWDGSKGKALFSFQRRIFVTDDPKLIKKLDDLGYTRQSVVEHWTIEAEKSLTASKFKKAEIVKIIKMLSAAGLKAVQSGEPVVTPITKNVHGPATLSPVTTKQGTEPPPESGLARMDLSVD